eukprot:gb/GFBE01010295.1/.p1 GENE.gb/GFBE01010295.1/~~gb/GFBE01010295.1/.p1  ORF type:complete len:180 (+),score=40.54 gb/GFBE01010295.1/:1-540(+)
MTGDVQELPRHMEKSTLYEEDALAGGHSAVWGSFYDGSTGAWGYACCRGVVKSQVCPHGDAKLAADETSVRKASRKREPESEQAELPGKGESIHELGVAAGDIHVGAELVRRFVAAVLKEWQESASPQLSAPPSAASLQLLVDKMLAMHLDKDVQGKIEKICRLSLSRDHRPRRRHTWI